MQLEYCQYGSLKVNEYIYEVMEFLLVVITTIPALVL
jgi:hypothetical protein